MQVLAQKPVKFGHRQSKAETALANGLWSDNNLRTIYSAPIIVNDGSAARQRFERAFRRLPAAFPRRPVLHEDRPGR